MAKSKQQSTFVGELFVARLYKRNQGRLTRQLTAVGAALLVFFGAYTLSQGPLNDFDALVRIGVPTGIFLVCAWIIYRVVNFPRFADFLISVEAEIDKVTWSSRQELYRATIVVVVTMFLLGAVLFVYDMFWQYFFKLVGFLKIY